MIDKRALSILTSTYWCSTGWRDNRVTPPNDLEYAKSKGLMFDPIIINHNQIVSRAVKTAARTRPLDVADAFVASLSSRRLDLRSALGSFAAVRHMPVHKLAPTKKYCLICGEYNSTRKSAEDLNVLNFERFKWGGVRHVQPLYTWFDLEQFADLDRPQPTDADKSILSEILAMADAIPPKGKLSELVRAIASVLSSNADERRMLMTILGFAGVLQPKEQPSFFSDYVKISSRNDTPAENDDWDFPISWWRGADGVNWKVAKLWFPWLKKK